MLEYGQFLTSGPHDEIVIDSVEVRVSVDGPALELGVEVMFDGG